MPDLTTQAIDVDFVKNKLTFMQRQRAYGYVHVTFERGIMQLVDVKFRFLPPSNKEYEEQELKES